MMTIGSFSRSLSSKVLSAFSCSAFSTASAKPRTKYVPRRALLYVPGSSEKMLKKVPGIKVDSLVLEMEDGVAANAKSEARVNIRKYLDSTAGLGKHNCFELGVRVNSVASELIFEDVKELAKAEHLPQAFMIPKIDSVEDLAAVFDVFRTAYGDRRILNTDIRMIIWIESARALLDMPRILNAALNLHKSAGFFKTDAIVFGSDDFCANIGATRSKEAIENLYARQRFVTCCKAFGLQAIDAVYIDIKNLEGLRKQCEEGSSWGFTGKQVIHPSQIETVQSAFLPSEDKIEWARSLMKEFIEHEKIGKGAFTFRGHMIDRPLLLQAMNVVKMLDRVNNSQS